MHNTYKQGFDLMYTHLHSQRCHLQITTASLGQSFWTHQVYLKVLHCHCEWEATEHLFRPLETGTSWTNIKDTHDRHYHVHASRIHVNGCIISVTHPYNEIWTSCAFSRQICLMIHLPPGHWRGSTVACAIPVCAWAMTMCTWYLLLLSICTNSCTCSHFWDHVFQSCSVHARVVLQWFSDLFLLLFVHRWTPNRHTLSCLVSSKCNCSCICNCKQVAVTSSHLLLYGNNTQAAAKQGLSCSGWCLVQKRIIGII